MRSLHSLLYNILLIFFAFSAFLIMRSIAGGHNAYIKKQTFLKKHVKLPDTRLCDGFKRCVASFFPKRYIGCVIGIFIGSVLGGEVLAFNEKFLQVKVVATGTAVDTVRDTVSRLLLRRSYVRLAMTAPDYEVKVMMKPSTPYQGLALGYVASVSIVAYYPEIARDLPIFQTMFMLSGSNDLSALCRRIADKTSAFLDNKFYITLPREDRL